MMNSQSGCTSSSSSMCSSPASRLRTPTYKHEKEPAEMSRNVIIDSEASRQNSCRSKRKLSVFVSHIPPGTTWTEVKQAFVTQQVGTPYKVYFKPGQSWAHAYFHDKNAIDDAIARPASPQGFLIRGQRVSVEHRNKKKKKKKAVTADVDRSESRPQRPRPFDLHQEPQRASSTSPGPQVQDLDKLMHELRIASEHVGRDPSPRRALSPFSSDRGKLFNRQDGISAQERNDRGPLPRRDRSPFTSGRIASFERQESISSGGQDRFPIASRTTSRAASLAQGYHQQQQERDARPGGTGTWTTQYSTANTHMALRWQSQDAKQLYPRGSQWPQSDFVRNIAPQPAATHSASMILSEHQRMDSRSQYRDSKWRQPRAIQPPQSDFVRNIAPPAAIHSASMILSEHRRMDSRSQYRDSKWRQPIDTQPPHRMPPVRNVTSQGQQFSPWTRPSVSSTPLSDRTQNPVGSLIDRGRNAVSHALPRWPVQPTQSGPRPSINSESPEFDS